jgi:hypothetical protein
MADLELAEVIRALRAELESAMIAGAGSTLRFEAKSLTVELQVGVSHAAEASGGVKFWVVEFGAGGSRTTEATQTVTLELAPILADGRAVRIAAGSDVDPRG